LNFHVGLWVNCQKRNIIGVLGGNPISTDLTDIVWTMVVSNSTTNRQLHSRPRPYQLRLGKPVQPQLLVNPGHTPCIASNRALTKTACNSTPSYNDLFPPISLDWGFPDADMEIA
jgi:hypothetical protein